jgi:hypothetical protein
METKFRLGILYTTIAVIQPNEDFNDWNDTHINQGFSWRPASVSFGTLNDNPECEVIVKTGNILEENSTAIRSIVVPFTVGLDGIEIASIADSQPLELPEGHYQLVFNAISNKQDSLDTYEFIFIKSQNPSARILKADEQLSPPEVLLMDASPAI